MVYALQIRLQMYLIVLKMLVYDILDVCRCL